MRIQGSADERVPAEGLLEAWLAVATADFLPAAPALAALERQTLAGWGDLSLGDKLKLLEAW